MTTVSWATDCSELARAVKNRIMKQQSHRKWWPLGHRPGPIMELRPLRLKFLLFQWERQERELPDKRLSSLSPLSFCDERKGQEWILLILWHKRLSLASKDKGLKHSNSSTKKSNPQTQTIKTHSRDLEYIPECQIWPETNLEFHLRYYYQMGLDTSIDSNGGGHRLRGKRKEEFLSYFFMNKVTYSGWAHSLLYLRFVMEREVMQWKKTMFTMISCSQAAVFRQPKICPSACGAELEISNPQSHK